MSIYDYTLSLQIDLFKKDIFYKRGLAYFNINNYQDSINDYTEVIKLDPYYLKVYH